MNRVLRAASAFFILSDILFPGAYAFAALSPQAIISLTNGDRLAAGLPALSENALLDRAAQMKALDMAQKGYYSHTTPEGYLPFYWFEKVGYPYLDVGENLDLVYSGDEKTVNSDWMNSPEHRANILLPQFSDIGVAAAAATYQGNAVTFVVELFGTPLPPAPLLPKAASSPAPPSAPAPAPAAASSPLPAVPAPAWAIFRSPYSPEKFLYSLQTFILSLQESTRQLIGQLSPDRVY